MRMLAILLALVLFAACDSSRNRETVSPPAAAGVPIGPDPVPARTFTGTWTGGYVVTSCSESGDYAKYFCATYPVGTIRLLSATLLQGETEVAASLGLAGLTADQQVSPVGVDGSISFDVRHSHKLSDLQLRASWRILQAGADRLNGSVRETWIETPYRTGSGVLEGATIDMRRAD